METAFPPLPSQRSDIREDKRVNESEISFPTAATSLDLGLDLGVGIGPLFRPVYVPVMLFKVWMPVRSTAS